MTKYTEATFSKLNHFWIDSGLLGLIVILREVESDVEKVVNDGGLILKGSETSIQNVLERAYEILIDRYYNLSTKKQRDDTTSYNFFYDSKGDKFVAFSKKKSVGIASLIYDKAPRPIGSSVGWTRKEKRELLINGKSTKRNRGILPPSHAYLQERMEEFLDKNGLDVTTSGLLMDGPNAVCPNVTIAVTASKKIKGACYFCGEDSGFLEEASQTIFPFITGSSGLLNFNPLCGKPEKVCWKCAFLGKFVPVNGFYLSQGDNLFAFFPYSISLEKMIDVYAPLQENGVAMLSSVLNSKRAIQVNIQIMRTFTKIKEMMVTHKELKNKIEEMEKKYDFQFTVVFEAIKQLIEPSQKTRKRIGF